MLCTSSREDAPDPPYPRLCPYRFLLPTPNPAVPGDDDIIDGHPVAWYRGIGLDQEGRPLPQARRKRITREEALRLEGGVVALPQSACPGGCSLRGQCVARGGEARCACWCARAHAPPDSWSEGRRLNFRMA